MPERGVGWLEPKSSLFQFERQRRVGPTHCVWLGPSDCYVYVKLIAEVKVLIVADPASGEESEVFATKSEIEDLTSVAGGVRFRVQGALFDLSPDKDIRLTDLELEPRLLREPRWAGDPPQYELRSPDCSMIASIAGNCLQIIDRARTHVFVEASSEAMEDWEIGNWSWARDSQTLVALLFDYTHVPRRPLTWWLEEDGERAGFLAQTRTGEPYPSAILVFFHVDESQITKVQMLDEPFELIFPVGWLRRSGEFVYAQTDRIMSQLCLYAAHPLDGLHKLADFKSSTFIEGLRLHDTVQELFFELDDNAGFLWISDHNGTRALWHFSTAGKIVKTLICKGVEIIQLLRQKGCCNELFVLGHASEFRPYDLHLFLIDLDTAVARKLTSEPGQHYIDISPSGMFYIDHHASMATNPTIDLSSAEGSFLKNIRTIESRGGLASQGITFDEVVAPAADGHTKLWGVLIKPVSISPGALMPVVDYIYNGPFMTWAPRTRYEAEVGLARALAEAGFAVLIVDGRGTPERGKEFQDVVFQSFGVNEIPDHVAVLDSIFAAYPYLDRTRVGICGSSWGGYMAIRGLLLRSDVYKVGVATNAVHDLIDHPAAAIEPYMGLREKNPSGYASASNIQYANRLIGALLLIHGTADRNAPLRGTMKMTAALTRCQRPHDLRLLVDQGHSISGDQVSTWLGLTVDYFQRNL